MFITYNPETELWTYQYQTFPTVHADNGKEHDVSHVSIDLGCLGAIEGHSASIGYQPETKGGESFKWDNLKLGDDPLTFELTSYNPPTDGVLTVKAGREVVEWDVQVPSCHSIPECGVSLMLAGAVALMVGRRDK